RAFTVRVALNRPLFVFLHTVDESNPSVMTMRAGKAGDTVHVTDLVELSVQVKLACWPLLSRA
ncbi:MAG TPA: hypothetical protein VG294_14550, partial [Solirubrobacteraceae bacterium]|nr:hypothetical protein [Solirubrobacteraceae bacterium]